MDCASGHELLFSFNQEYLRVGTMNNTEVILDEFRDPTIFISNVLPICITNLS